MGWCRKGPPPPPPPPLFIQTDGTQNGLHHGVGIAIGAGSAILKVALSIVIDAPGDTYAAATVGNSGTEVIDGTGLVLSGQTTGIVLSLLGIIGPDVALVALGELGHRLLNVPDAAILAHRLRGDIGMGTGAIPVTRHGLGIQSGNNLKEIIKKYEIN